MRTNPFKFYDKVITRAPLKPIAYDYTIKSVLDFFNQDLAKEALYLASPILYSEFLRHQSGEIKDEKKVNRLIVSLTKYFIRIHTRATPFGIFAGTGIVNWSDETKIVLSNSHKKHTRLDMDYLCELCNEILKNEELDNELLLYPNTSIYKLNDSLRYIETKKSEFRRSRQISSITSSEYLDFILNSCKEGKYLINIAEDLIKFDSDIELDEAIEFIKTLKIEQILTTELEPTVSGKEYFKLVMDFLKSKKFNENSDCWQLRQSLMNVESMLSNIDSSEINEIDTYKNLQLKLSSLGTPALEGKIVQTDLNLDFLNNTLNCTIQTDIYKALEVLNAISKKNENKVLQNFIDKFNERYENNEVPLMLLLDSETGIGYGDAIFKDDNDLTKDVNIPYSEGKSVSMDWDNINKWFLDLLLRTKEKNTNSIDVGLQDISKLEANWNNLPPSFSIMFRLLKDGHILLESIGNSSAVNLLGRFSHCNENIEKIVLDIAKKEQETNRNVIFAEIIHLPEERLGNILQRTSFRDYEIPYLAQSSKNGEHKILLSDLYVSVVAKRVILKSKKLNKEIIPRLGTAHNFEYASQPVYRFLGDLQFQNFRGTLFMNWNLLGSKIKMVPRVTVGKVIIHVATWHLDADDIKLVLGEYEKTENLISFIEKFNIPRYFYLADYDNELLIDCENMLSLKVFIQSIKKDQGAILKEFIEYDEKGIVNIDNQMYCNQFIALLIKEKSSFEGMPTFDFANYNKIQHEVKSIFEIGSEWLYYKIYSGPNTLNTILIEAISLISEDLLNNNLIDKWFFIRYADPDNHLRVRFHMADVANLGSIVQCVNDHLKKYVENNLIWKIQIDSYKREIERYGNSSMEISEILFFYDSSRILYYLKLKSDQGNQEEAWLWCIKIIDEMLNYLKFTDEEKLNLFIKLDSYYKPEFNQNKVLNEQLNLKYRLNSELIEKALEHQSNNDTFLLNSSLKIKDCCDQILKLEGDSMLEVTKYDLAQSYIHMTTNRLFTSFQRKHELVIYNYMKLFFRSKKGKASNLLNEVAYI